MKKPGNCMYDCLDYALGLKGSRSYFNNAYGIDTGISADEAERRGVQPTEGCTDVLQEISRNTGISFCIHRTDGEGWYTGCGRDTIHIINVENRHWMLCGLWYTQQWRVAGFWAHLDCKISDKINELNGLEPLTGMDFVSDETQETIELKRLGPEVTSTAALEEQVETIMAVDHPDSDGCVEVSIKDTPDLIATDALLEQEAATCTEGDNLGLEDTPPTVKDDLFTGPHWRDPVPKPRQSKSAIAKSCVSKCLSKVKMVRVSLMRGGKAKTMVSDHKEFPTVIPATAPEFNEKNLEGETGLVYRIKQAMVNEVQTKYKPCLPVAVKAPMENPMVIRKLTDEDLGRLPDKIFLECIIKLFCQTERSAEKKRRKPLKELEVNDYFLGAFKQAVIYGPRNPIALRLGTNNMRQAAKDIGMDPSWLEKIAKGVVTAGMAVDAGEELSADWMNNNKKIQIMGDFLTSSGKK